MYAHEFNYELLFQEESDRFHGPGAPSVGPGSPFDPTCPDRGTGFGSGVSYSQLVDRLGTW